MASIRPISDLRNSANEISDFCRQTREPVYITRNGSGDMVVLNIDEYERRMARIELYEKLAAAERHPEDEYEDYTTAAEEIRKRIHWKV